MATSTSHHPEESFLCIRCQEHPGVVAAVEKQPQDGDGNDDDDDAPIVCCVCMGLWQLPCKEKLKMALKKACEPYGGMSANRFARLANHGPTATFAGDIALRYQYYKSRRRNNHKNNNNNKSELIATFQRDLKRHIYRQIDEIIQEEENQSKKVGGDADDDEDDADDDIVQPNPEVAQEEQGFLSIHILCLPPKDAPSILGDQANNQKTKRKSHRQRPFTTQGGDPRVNLEARLEAQGYQWISSLSVAQDNGVSLSQLSNLQPSPAMEYHAIVFRRPMFVYGCYTKSRRDVSQTPFVVMKDALTTSDGDTPENHKKRKTAETLGVTSVEEQICGPIETMVGISTLNNPPPRANNNNQKNNNNPPTGTLYGMIKFHGSGREDMDVRMLVRSDSPSCKGRPFCIQIIDALRPIHKEQQLTSLIHSINATETTNNDTKTIVGHPSQHNLQCFAYGQNPLGVGIAPDEFQMVPAHVFSGLQQSTESKVKHYGCYCWSQQVLSKDDDYNLQERLFGHISFPLTIHQKTPLRVLHRRSNLVRERQILQATAQYIDDHHLWLSLSTSAGTYVKEFVSGDLGRSQPSIASLLGCKTALIELDCEGIEMTTTTTEQDKSNTN
jgi:tRNA U54 and U55 pseudouridine synthase Pus10